MANGGYYFVSGKLVYQRDDTAEGIINTIQITDGVTLTDAQKFYVRYIVTNLIRAGIWTKIKALYGFAGGTAATHRWNWKDMRDLDAAFRLTFPNGMTHDVFGITGNGTTQYANTNFSPAVNLTLSNYHISFYSSKDTNSTTDDRNIGSTSSDVTNNIALTIRRSDAAALFLGANNLMSNNGASMVSNPKNKGFILGNVLTGSTGMYITQYGRINFNFMFGNNSALPFSSITIGGLNRGGSIQQLSLKSCGFASIGDGLTDLEAIQMSNIITFAQGILGRQ